MMIFVYFIMYFQVPRKLIFIMDAKILPVTQAYIFTHFASFPSYTVLFRLLFSSPVESFLILAILESSPLLSAQSLQLPLSETWVYANWSRSPSHIQKSSIPRYIPLSKSACNFEFFLLTRLDFCMSLVSSTLVAEGNIFNSSAIYLDSGGKCVRSEGYGEGR